jgi:DNA-binding LacI/PurR family transcriptional regulator
VTLTEKCTNRLREEILAGQLDSGEGLITERWLCRHLEVSRLTVRRCLKRLREENLIRAIPYKGYAIARVAQLVDGATGRKRSATQNRVLFGRHSGGTHVSPLVGADAVWESACREAAGIGLEMELCRAGGAELMKDLRGSGRNDIYGVIWESYERELAELLLVRRIPTVLIQNRRDESELDAVIQDDAGGVEQAVDHLWKLGHRRIGMISWGRGLTQSRYRRAALAQSLVRRGADATNVVGLSDRYDFEGGREATRRLFSREERPTALILAHLEMAAGAFDELESLGVSPEQDVSIIAWGSPETREANLMGTRWAKLPLDLISWPREEMGRMAVRLLEARWKDPAIPPMCELIRTRLILNGSSRAPGKKAGR